MKKIFMTLSASATLVLAIALNSCNNAEEVKKQTEEQNGKIQSAVDEKLNGLQEGVNAECSALVDSLAKVKFAEWTATEGKKKTAKPIAKPKPKKAETVGNGKPKMGTETSTTIGNGKPKMGDTKPNTIGNGKPKMGTGNK